MSMKLPDHKVAYLLGGPAAFKRHIFSPYEDLVCDFLADLSRYLMHDPCARIYPDVIAFAFFCRRANLAKLKHEFSELRTRLGLGLVFHITPSNIPVVSSFSFVLGLLAGNSNIVKLPPSLFPQSISILSGIERILTAERYRTIAESTVFMQYDPDDAVTALFSSICDARIIWGGDETIKTIRRIPLGVRSIDIGFADRYSLCVMDAKAVCQIEAQELSRLSTDFYNDTYVMDQNACSSPHLVVWLGTPAEASGASERFWPSVHKEASARYQISSDIAVNKATALCEDAVENACASRAKRFGNLLYVIELSSLPGHISTLRGQCGYFFEYQTARLEDMASYLNKKVQTVSYYGVSKEDLKSFVDHYRPQGIDRFVPVGSALDISTIWDGYDIVRTLSRIVDIR